MAANNEERSFTETETNQKKITIFFTLCNNVGELCKALEVLKVCLFEDDKLMTIIACLKCGQA